MQDVLAVLGRGTDWCLVVIILILWVLCPFLVIRQIARWIKQSIKARQDLARGVADIADRMGRLESKVEESETPKQ